MLILLPPSETKAPVRRGRALDLARLSFPALTPTRSAVLDALIDLSAAPDAVERLRVPPTLGDVVARNVGLRTAPTAPAEAVYAGVLYDALDLDSLDPPAVRRARAWIVVVSGLWGAVRLRDRIPPYRLSMSGRLPGLPPLPQLWQGPLDTELGARAGRGLVVDCRSTDYVAAWRPAGPLADRTVVVKVVRDRDGQRSAVSHSAKQTRGLVVRRLVTEGPEPRRPEALAEALSPHFDLGLQPPARSGQPWQLHVVEPAA